MIRIKAVWKGMISFGLVSIPIKLYSAVEPKVFGFKLLCGKCHTPLHYKRWCESCKKEVKWENVVKGIEITKGNFFVLTKENFEKIRPEKSDYIDVIEFIDKGMIDPIFFEKHYYIVPEKEKEKAYFLFQEVLEATAKVALGRFVMKEKEYTCAIESYKGGLLLTTLNYTYEIRDIRKLEELKARPRLNAEELKLAKELIAKLHKKEFDISEFKDTFAEKLKEMIKKMLRGEKIVVKKARRKEKATLMEALKASIEK